MEMVTGGANPPFDPGDFDFFFTDPTVNPCAHRRPNGEVSVLYLSRREVQETLADIKSIVSESELLKYDRRRLFASSMLMLAGIDLLAKFADGSDSTGPGDIGCRFRAFVEKYMKLPADQAKVLWRVRNSLPHSFGLYDRDKGKKIALTGGKAGIPTEPSAIVTQLPTEYQVSVEYLYLGYVQAIQGYNSAIPGTAKLEGNFARLFGHYGVLVMR